MYYLIRINDSGDLIFKRFSTIEELKNDINNNTSNDIPRLKTELENMVVIEGREYKASLLKMKYEKHINLEAKE